MEKSLILTTSSPEDLSKKISTTKGLEQYNFVSIAIRGNDVHVCPFRLPKIPLKELTQKLEFEAVELLNLPLEEIEIDFQILDSSDETIKGIFICTSRKLLNEYMHVLKATKLAPIKITSHLIASIDAFLVKHSHNVQRYCFLEFSQDQKINLAVFNNCQCELLREITYENLDEAKQEIIQTLRSACANSKAKKYDHIYLTGALEHKEEIVRLIEDTFHITAQVDQCDHIFLPCYWHRHCEAFE